MTDNQKVYIRGVMGRGIDVIAALERLGGKTDQVGSMRLYAFGNIPLHCVHYRARRSNRLYGFKGRSL